MHHCYQFFKIKSTVQNHASPWNNLGSAGPIEIEAAGTGLRCPPAKVRFEVADRLGFRESRCGQSLAIVLTKRGIGDDEQYKEGASRTRNAVMKESLANLLMSSTSSKAKNPISSGP